MGFEDWSNNKKKKKPSSFEEWSNANRGITKAQEEEDERKRQAYLSRNKSDDDIAPVREATWGDVFGGSFSRGYQNSVLGSETYKKIVGQENEADIAKSILEQDKYQFDTDNLFKKAVSGAMEQLGQQWYNLTDPETQALMIGGGATGAGIAAVGGQLGPQALLPEEVLTVPGGFLAGVGAGWASGSAANAFEIETGAAYNELIEAGVSDETAKNIALGVGGVNAGLELLQVDELLDAFKIVKKTGSDSLVKKVGKILVERGIDVAKETAQEVAQEGVTIAGTQIGSKLETGEWAYDKGEVGERLGETALSSALTFGAMNVPATVSNFSSVVKQNHDAHQLTASEKEVVNKIYETELEQKQSDGKELTKKEKDEIYDSVVDRMEKGQIDIDTIESTLGGDSYKAYTDHVNNEEKLKAEYDELSDIKKSDLTTKQEKRLTELEGMNLDDTTKRDELRQKLDETISPMLKGSKLTESYRERERRRQTFEADLSKYKGKQREAVERAVKSGVLNNTHRSHELVDVLSKIEAEKGIAFDYTDNKRLKESGFWFEGRETNGFVNKKTNTVTFNVESNKAWQFVVGHEITHVLEDTEAYGALRESLYKYAESKGVLESRRAAVMKAYEGKDVDIDTELTADLVGDYLFTDRDFINHLTGNRTLFQKIYDEIKYLWNVATGKEKAEIERVKAEFDRAWKEYSADTKNNSEAKEYSDDEVKYSLREEAPPKETGTAYKVFFVKDGKLYPPMVANPEGADTPMGVWLNADVGTAAPPSKTGRAQVKAGGKGTQGGGGSLAFRPGWHLGDLPRASQFDRVNPETGKKELFPENFVWAEVEYAKDVDYQEEAMSYGYTENGKFRHAYAGLPRLPENGYYRYRTNPKPDTVPWVITGAMKVNRLLSDAEVNEILEKNGVPPVHRQGGDVGLDKFGFDEGGTDSAAKSGVEYDKTSESYSPIQYSISSWDSSDYVADREKASKDMAKNLGVSEEQASKYIDDVNSIAKMIADDKARLDYEASPGRSAFVNNSEYGGSIDFSTICKKRRLFTGTFEAIQNALPDTVLTADEVLEIRKMMKDKGYEVSCGLCYVEGSRTNMGLYTKQFIERYAATNPEYVPNMAEMNTATGQETLRKEHPEVYEAYEHFMNNYGRLAPTDKALFASQQKPKMYQMATEYKGEILKKYGGKDKSAAKAKSVAEKNKNGGIRLQSFSDFEIIHLIDSMQVIMDMSRAGLAGQAYTKVPDFAWALGDTGLKINLSLIAKDVDANGKLILDEVEGMKEADAMALRDRYSDNVGTIIVVFTDEQLKAAMADERIDYIIPYHRSQWKTSQYEAMGLPENTKDYTNFQSESYIVDVFNSKGKKLRPDNYMPNSYWDFTKSGKENAEAYLAMCADNNRKPKFSHLLVDNGDGSYSLQPDGSTDGYWKTLIDFKMYNNDGIGVPQNPVTPDFNMEEAQRMLNDYTGGHAKFPVAKDIVDEFVSKHPDNIAPMPDVQYSLSDKYGLTTENGMAVDRYADMEGDSVFRSHFMKRNPSMVDAIVKNRSQTKTENFKEWFGDSVAVNKDGEPLLVFRGTSSDNSVLDHNQKPIWFSNNVMYAEKYSEDMKWTDKVRRSSKIFGGAEKKVIPAYISIENPADFGNTDAVFSDSVAALSLELGIPEEELRAVWEKNGSKKKVWETLHTADMMSLLSEYGFDGATAVEDGCKTWCVFDSKQVKSAVANNGKFDPDKPDIRFSLSVGSVDSNGNDLSPAVQKRFANSKAVDEDGKLKVLYHGTYGGEFYTFDKSKGSVEGDFGSGFYFTDSESDVESNYEGGGADFENKVARRAEQIEADEEIDYYEAEERAREELFVGSKKFEVYLNIENPAVVGETLLLDPESFYDEIDREDYDSEEDYESDLEYFVSDKIDGIIWDVQRNIDIDGADAIAEVLWNAINEGGVDIERLKKDINDLYLEDEEGNLVGNEVTRQIVESLGYDGIIDNTVSSKFNMGLDEGTTHYIVFKPNQIKAIDNQNPTDDPDIRRSLSEEGEEYAPVGNYSTPFRELALERDDAPVSTNTPTAQKDTPTVEDSAMFPDDYAPMTEDEANAIQDAKAEADKAAEGEPKSRKQLHKNILDNVKATFGSSGYDFDDVLSKAKNLSTFATVDNTPQRVMEKALGYKEGGVLADLTVNKVAQNESAGIKWLNSFTDRKNGLLAQISRQYNIKPGSKESAAAQMYAEGFYVNDNNDIVAYGDAELAKDFPNEGVQNRIKGLAYDPRIRQIYDETLEAINASRTRNAYPEIQKLDNYFLHFRAMDDTFSRLGLPFNPNDIRAKDLPTDLNGVTADLKPGQPYFASAMHRTGKRTSFDLLGGLERYLTSAKNQIYHIDDIQTLRALRNYIADTYGQANGLEGIDVLSEEEAQDRIEQVYNSHLSTFAKFLNEEANVLAGKTALIDRGLEGVIGRRGMTFLDTVNRQVGSNMVGFNISSALTNFLPVAQTFAKTNKFDFTKAFAQTVSNKIGSVFGKGDGFAENSPVIIRRKGADRFYRTPWQKAGDAGYVLMGAVDDISTELIARTKFNELTRKGMDEQAAHIETDKWVSRLVSDRSLGQQPQLYNSKTLGIFTKFQLEVRNQLDSQFYDTIQEAKVSNEDIENRLVRNAMTAAKITSTFAQLAVVQHLYGKAFESVAGYNPAFDIIEVLMTTFGWDDEEDSEDTALDNIEQGFLALLEDLPYTSTFTGGRIPLESALPIEQVIKGVDQYGNEKSRLETLGEAAPYYVLPGGYGQIKKTAAGLNMFSDEHPVSGSYTDSGNLRFPVEDTPLNRAQAAIFGQYASKNAREYFDNGYAPLKEKQIQEYIDVDMPISDYWKYRKGLAKQDKLENKLDYISGLDLPVSKKNILANNVTERKEPIDLTNYEDFGSLEEFDFATKQPEKYAFAKSVGGYSAYKTFSSELGDIKADKDANGKTINGSRKEKVIEYINNLDADYHTKIILLKSEYPSEDSYNAEIIEYLNSRDDITYEEQVSILTELGFRVTADGQIYAD